jgi:hypothetical protein
MLLSDEASEIDLKTGAILEKIQRDRNGALP